MKMLRLIIAFGVLAGLAILAIANEKSLARYFKPPWMSQCDRLDARCEQAKSNLGDALVCGVSGLASLGGRTEEGCAKANEALDRK